MVNLNLVSDRDSTGTGIGYCSGPEQGHFSSFSEHFLFCSQTMRSSSARYLAYNITILQTID